MRKPKKTLAAASPADPVQELSEGIQKLWESFEKPRRYWSILFSDHRDNPYSEGEAQALIFQLEPGVFARAMPWRKPEIFREDLETGKTDEQVVKWAALVPNTYWKDREVFSKFVQCWKEGAENRDIRKRRQKRGQRREPIRDAIWDFHVDRTWEWGQLSWPRLVVLAEDADEQAIRRAVEDEWKAEVESQEARSARAYAEFGRTLIEHNLEDVARGYTAVAERLQELKRIPNSGAGFYADKMLRCLMKYCEERGQLPTIQTLDNLTFGDQQRRPSESYASNLRGRLGLRGLPTRR